MNNNSEALLSSDGRFTIFSFGNHVIRFKAPYFLEKYTETKEWDNGYIVVMAKYRHKIEDEEEYIDLIPILKDLYMEPEEFLKPKVIVNSTPLIALCHVDALDVSKDFIFNGNLI